MYKVLEANVEGSLSWFVLEDYEGEAQDLFTKADKEADGVVNVIYEPCSITGDDLILHREEWITNYKERLDK